MNIRCGRAGPRSRDDGADESERSCSPFAPGTPAIPLSQLQQHSLALQGSSGQSITASSSGASQSSQGQQAVFRLPATVSLTGGAMPQQLQTIQVQSSSQSSSISTSDSSPEISQTSTASTATVSLPATIVTSSVPTSMTGHMMYPSPHTVMYASAPTLTDGSLAVLNAFTQGPAAMQVSHTPTQDTDTGFYSDIKLYVQCNLLQLKACVKCINVKLKHEYQLLMRLYKQLKQMWSVSLMTFSVLQMVIGQQSSGSSSSLTELQVVNLDASQNAKND
ncbi:serum response factor isoform X1 [Labeo rohita]|uniref:Serum response factor isoform X1 n=1 Tax=Labeo rohita TaxID=84645 RepID=A0A498MQ57_LABRO|nr:serum response factor isoform X1 [Labeo rohita]